MEVLKDYFERAREGGREQGILDHLGTVPLFDDLTEPQLAYLATQMQGRVYAPHERIFERGSAGQELHVVLEGDTELRQKDSSGAERVVTTASPGRSFGEIGFLTGDRRNLAAVNGPARSVQLVLSFTDFERVQALWPDIGQSIYRCLLELISERLKAVPPATRNFLMWGYAPPPVPAPREELADRLTAILLPIVVVLLVIALFWHAS